MGNNVGKNLSKMSNSKYSQKLFDQSVEDALKTIQKNNSENSRIKW